MRLCNRYKERVCAKKREDLSIVKGRERRGVQVHKWTIEKMIYWTLEVILNVTGIFCRKVVRSE